MALKAGTDDKKKVAIAATLGLVALLYAAYTLFSGPPAPPAGGRPVPVAGSAAGSPAAGAAAAGVAALAPAAATPLDPTLHPQLMAENEAFVYRGSGRNIFSQNSAPAVAAVQIEQPRGPVRPLPAVYTPPAGPPPPPTIDLRFFGYAARHDGSRKAFLLHGDDVFIAAEGDVVSHRYRVVHIAPTSIVVEDLPYHNSQSLPLVQN
ncbi:MAG TPA: hypothetical protein VGD62_00120 [Acidobacteriaceae bacterium]